MGERASESSVQGERGVVGSGMPIHRHERGFLVATAPSSGPFSPLEAVEQGALVRWLRDEGIPFHSIPNSGAANKTRGAALKREGLVAGVPDMFIYPGPVVLAVEMKRSNGRLGDLRPEQVEWLAFLARYGGVEAGVAFGFAAAKELVEAFRGGRRVPNEESGR